MYTTDNSIGFIQLSSGLDNGNRFSRVQARREMPTRFQGVPSKAMVSRAFSTSSFVHMQTHGHFWDDEFARAEPCVGFFQLVFIVSCIDEV